MKRTAFLVILLAASVTISGVAGADEGRGRGRHRVRTWEQTMPSLTGAANTSSTIQEGANNAASISQTGIGNTAGIRQFGSDNSGAITQTGANNTACLIQAGRNLDGGIQQIGDNQSSGILQTRWGVVGIPVDVCATATNRGDLAAYAPVRPGAIRPRGRGYGGSEE